MRVIKKNDFLLSEKKQTNNLFDCWHFKFFIPERLKILELGENAKFELVADTI